MGRENLQHLDANRGHEPARKVFSAEIERTQRNPSLCPPQLCAENLWFMESFQDLPIAQRGQEPRRRRFSTEAWRTQRNHLRVLPISALKTCGSWRGGPFVLR